MKKLVFLTGAGMSVESGFKTFRGNDGLWEGSMYVFDKRMTLDFDQDTVSLGRCTHCDAITNNFENCADPGCKTLALVCPDCKPAAAATVCAVCEQFPTTKQTPKPALV